MERRAKTGRWAGESSHADPGPRRARARARRRGRAPVDEDVALRAQALGAGGHAGALVDGDLEVAEPEVVLHGEEVVRRRHRRPVRAEEKVLDATFPFLERSMEDPVRGTPPRLAGPLPSDGAGPVETDLHDLALDCGEGPCGARLAPRGAKREDAAASRATPCGVPVAGQARGFWRGDRGRSGLARVVREVRGVRLGGSAGAAVHGGRRLGCDAWRTTDSLVVVVEAARPVTVTSPRAPEGPRAAVHTL